jgi:hypothetical protein
MNPYKSILTDSYGDDSYADYTGVDAAVVLLLQIMADNYAGDMPQPMTCSDKYRWCLDQLDKYRPNKLIDWIERDWSQVCPDLSSLGDHRKRGRLTAFSQETRLPRSSTSFSAVPNRGDQR